VLADALARFGLDGARIERSFPASTMNDNLLVVARDGAQVVLRRYRRNLELPRLEFQARFQQFLFESDYPVPKVVPATDGSLLVNTEAGPFGLSSFVPGEYYDFERPQHAVEAGRRLAQFHLLTEAFEDPPPSYDLVQPVREWWTNTEGEIAALEAFFGGGIDEEIAELRARLATLHADLPLAELDALPSGWIHNDYHGRNLLYEGDTVRALLDFDKIQQAPYILDLARGIHSFARTARGSQDVRPDIARLFVDAYSKVRLVDADERRAILALWGMEDGAPYDRMYRMLTREGHDAHTVLRGELAWQRERRRNAAELADIL
jgi:Ser/Thr protein kinase RdoA (MazF antagonist)